MFEWDGCPDRDVRLCLLVPDSEWLYRCGRLENIINGVWTTKYSFGWIIYFETTTRRAIGESSAILMFRYNALIDISRGNWINRTFTFFYMYSLPRSSSAASIRRNLTYTTGKTTELPFRPGNGDRQQLAKFHFPIGSDPENVRSIYGRIGERAISVKLLKNLENRQLFDKALYNR